MKHVSVVGYSLDNADFIALMFSSQNVFRALLILRITQTGQFINTKFSCIYSYYLLLGTNIYINKNWLTKIFIFIPDPDRNWNLSGPLFEPGPDMQAAGPGPSLRVDFWYPYPDPKKS